MTFESPSRIGNPRSMETAGEFSPTFRGNEENAPENFIDGNDERITKRTRTGATPSKMNSSLSAGEETGGFLTLESLRGAGGRIQDVIDPTAGSSSSSSTMREWLGKNHDKSRASPKRPSSGSKTNEHETRTEVFTSSSSLRDWRKDSARKKPGESRPSFGSGRKGLPPAAPTSHASSSHSYSSSASSLIKKMSDAKSAADRAKPRSSRTGFTPIRIKPKIKKEEVQATDNGYASVAKLSAWLADDPTSTKKVRHVRRGMNVIMKSRKFESGLQDVIVEAQISKGAVSEKKGWLKAAFSEDSHEEDEEHASIVSASQKAKQTWTPSSSQSDIGAASVSVGNKKKWLQSVFEQSEGERQEVAADDTGSSISVTDKKQWLKNAFKKEGHVPREAQSDIGPVRSESRDDVSARAKKRWLERSGRNNGKSPSKPPISAAIETSSPWTKKDRNKSRDSWSTGPRQAWTAPPPEPISARKPPVPVITRTKNSRLPRVQSYSIGVRDKCLFEATDRMASDRQLVRQTELDEDTTPVDFRAARQLLVKRSEQNGSDLKVKTETSRRQLFSRQGGSRHCNPGSNDVIDNGMDVSQLTHESDNDDTFDNPMERSLYEI